LTLLSWAGSVTKVCIHLVGWVVVHSCRVIWIKGFSVLKHCSSIKD
jgi:hypothetical protein